VEQPGTRSLQLASKGTGNGSGAHGQSTRAATEVVAVPVLSLRPGDARHYAKMWQDFAQELDERVHIIDPSVRRPFRVSMAELNASLTVSMRVFPGFGLRGLVCDDSVSTSERGRPSRLPFREAREGP
jgi:hypothetical protein